MYIRRFSVKNFMIHRATSVALHPITVFVGPNNAGKSALFDALINFTMVSRGRLGEAFGQGPYSFRFRKSHGTAAAARVSFEVEISEKRTDDRFLTYLVSYAETPGPMDAPRFQIYDERLVTSSGEELFSRADVDASRLGEALKYISPDQSVFAAIRRAQFSGVYEEVDPLVTHVAREVSRIGKFRLNPQFLSQPSRLPDVTAWTGEPDAVEQPPSIGPAPSIDYRGDGLASVLYFLDKTASPILDVVVDRLGSAIAGFSGFEFNTVPPDRVGFNVRFDDARGTVPAANLSDGTLALIGLIVLLANTSRQPVICIEEPENGLTPHSTRYVYEAMRDVAYGTGGTTESQLLISSHSPYVIVEAWNGEERNFIYEVTPASGRAQVRPFPDAIKALGLHLEKDRAGKRDRLNLNVADQIMDGYLTESEPRAR